MQSVIKSTTNNAAIMYPIILTISRPVSTLSGVKIAMMNKKRASEITFFVKTFF